MGSDDPATGVADDDAEREARAEAQDREEYRRRQVVLFDGTVLTGAEANEGLTEDGYAAGKREDRRTKAAFLARIASAVEAAGVPIAESIVVGRAGDDEPPRVYRLPRVMATGMQSAQRARASAPGIPARSRDRGLVADRGGPLAV